MDITEEYLICWKDDEDDSNAFRANIARLDKPENQEYWNSLTEEQREQEDESIFYYVYSEDDYKSLIKHGGWDFRVLEWEDN